MAEYEIVFRPSVEKDFRSLTKSVIARVLARIAKLKEDPFPRQAVKLLGAERLYRIRVSDYRIIYGIDKQAEQITIHYVRHRRDVYDKL
jgi:mRNA interferase RelE/StbE